MLVEANAQDELTKVVVGFQCKEILDLEMEPAEMKVVERGT